MNHSSAFFIQLLCQATNKEGVVPSSSLLLSPEDHSLDEIDPELFEYISDVVDGLLVDVSVVVVSGWCLYYGNPRLFTVQTD